ncbi:xanthine dehydrogenase family protein molybdopterin-binding subunit [Variovorax saccharolyticus]|uniref:xanthine dehydrogenase family protein molybdopterin-binding subunit n=1 Tax=Variovorax saccharolyticus TaxID=3053516 RepID=UPI002574FA6D|nr:MULTISPECIES: xanthine dehydrogenase family protein molybdopterin-binding subunit [unclassified Variovorax]MDM0022308.1 xanthine dehydrogenase family protein molybdopterin-binding subunit [Variovorax sp. J22R187]MDM0028864.1 xanthine dehydrogenase family protein molybdopterin-binding subunit [Variovorax sp. J31P216]
MKLEPIADSDLAGVSRRHFLAFTATGALGGGMLLGFGLPARGELRDSLTTDAAFAPNAFLRIDRAGVVTFVMPVIEMGQGTYTSIPMLIAEELEVDVDKVAIEHSPPDDKIYVNPLIGVQMTGGSTAIRGTYVPLRRAGATARVMLVTAAAQRWSVDPSSCRAQNGEVVHGPTGRRLGYGGLVDAAAKLPVPEKVVLKEPADFKLIGTPHRRLDTSGKVNGFAKFGIDSRLPGMKFAVVSASPTFGGKLVSLDEAKAKAVPGVSQVVRLDDAVAIVARHTWAAKQGLAAADPQWEAGSNARLSTADISRQLASASERPGAVARHDGDAAAVMAQAAGRVDAVYEQPFLAHAAMEPMNCTVHMTKDACDIWVGTQVPGLTQAAVMKLTGFKREQVRVHNHLLGGGFGRRLEFDGTVRAVQIAQHVEGPVQVIWTREEDIQHDMYRPYYYDRLSAGVDTKGKTLAWSHRIAGSSIVARYSPAWIKDGIDPDAVDGSANQPYGIADIHVDWVAAEPPGVPTAFWRGVGVTRGTFAVESFVDELAANAKQDPLDYRVAMLDKNPRAKTVLQLAAQQAGWGKPLPAGQARGIALCTGFGSYIAQVVQITTDKDGTVTPMRAWCVVDCGVVVNPDTVRAQMESGIVFGLSAALHGEITIKNGRVEQTNFGDYRVLRINEIPQIDVHIVKSLEAPGGIGEPGTSCVMPALTNAIFAASGKRIRKLPVGEQLRPASQKLV